MVPMMRKPRASNARAETKDWIRFMGSTENFQNEMGLQTVTGFGNGNGRIVSKDRDAIGERIPVDVVVVALDPSDGRFNVGDADGGDGTARDALGDRSTEGLDCGGIHGFDGPVSRDAAT